MEGKDPSVGSSINSIFCIHSYIHTLVWKPCLKSVAHAASLLSLYNAIIFVSNREEKNEKEACECADRLQVKPSQVSLARTKASVHVYIGKQAN